MFFWSNLYTLSDISITKTTKLGTNQIFNCEHFFLIEFFCFIITKFKFGTLLLIFFIEFLIFLHCFWGQKWIFIDLFFIRVFGHFMSIYIRLRSQFPFKVFYALLRLSLGTWILIWIKSVVVDILLIHLQICFTNNWFIN